MPKGRRFKSSPCHQELPLPLRGAETGLLCAPLSDSCDVSVIGAATATDHSEMWVSRKDALVVIGELIWIAHVELLSLVELRVAPT